MGVAILAACVPSLLAYNVSPSPTFLNQALALALWGAFAGTVPAAAPAGPVGRGRAAGAWPLQAAIAILVAAALWSWGPGALPASLSLSAVGMLAAAALLVHAGAVSQRSDGAVDLFACFALAWVAAGVLNLAIGVVQVFAPGLADGDWIAHTSVVGRAVGNLRQPNHLSSVLLWAAIAVVALVELRRLPRAVGALLFAGMVFGVVLTASRTGLVSVGMLAAWALLDRRLHRSTRALLLAAPVAYALGWVAMSWWAEFSGHTFGGAARLAETDVSGSRFGIWANTVALVRDNFWTGVGWGEFNIAWSLTPFPGRPTAFFDHTHNLPLQLAVELGVPLAVLVTGLLLLALWRVWRLAMTTEGERSLTLRAALVFVLMIGMHSLLEYPLWYAYFLLPAAWAFGYGLGARTEAGPVPAARSHGGGLMPAAALAVLLSALSVWDYTRVAAIFVAPDDAEPLEQRIARGQRSVLFSHHADYAAATTEVDPALRRHAFDGATHYLLDTRLMIAWAEARAAAGDVDGARHLVQRLREFRNPLAKEFLEACDQPPPAGDPPPFQCQVPARPKGWRDFLAR